MTRGIGIQYGPVEGLSDGYTAGKNFTAKVSQDCQLLSSYAGISEGKESCSSTNTTID